LLGYAVDIKHIGDIREKLQEFGSMDEHLLESYDTFTGELDRVASRMADAACDPAAEARHAREMIEAFEAELRSIQAGMRTAKATVVGLM
jgi:hypothetical protein